LDPYVRQRTDQHPLYGYAGAEVSAQSKGARMSLIVWSVIGLISGYLANRFVSTAGTSILTDAGLGIVGAIMGGWLFNAIGPTGLNELSGYNLIAPVIGAALLLFTYHFFTWHSLGKR